MKILFASNKGGVGKTTVAIQIAVLLQGHGKKVCIIKADKNNDLIDFVEEREKIGGTLTVIAQSGDLQKAVERANQKFDFVLIDCAGHDSEEFRSALQVADLYLCLIKPSSDFEVGTLNNVTVTVRHAEEFNPGLRTFVVMNQIGRASCRKRE